MDDLARHHQLDSNYDPHSQVLRSIGVEWLFVSRQIVGMREGGRPWVFEPDQRISLMMQQQQQVA